MQSDGYVTALEKTTGVLQFSTYFGGQGEDVVRAVAATTSQGVVLISGWTTSTDFPLASPLTYGPAGMADAFVAIIDAAGSTVRFSTLFGGENNDEAVALSVVGSAIVIAGKTRSNDLPIQNPLQQHFGGGPWDGFVTRIDIDDNSLCGDFDRSQDIDIADVVYMVRYIFADGNPPLDSRKGDVDCDGAPTLSDAVYLITYIFGDGMAPCANCQ